MAINLRHQSLLWSAVFHKIIKWLSKPLSVWWWYLNLTMYSPIRIYKDFKNCLWTIFTYEIHLMSADAMQISSRFKKRELRSCWELTSNLTFCKTIPPHNSSNIFIQVFKPFCMYYISVLERFLSSIRNTADRCVGTNVTNLWPGDFTITQIPELTSQFCQLCFDWQDILRFLSEIFRNYRYSKTY